VRELSALDVLVEILTREFPVEIEDHADAARLIIQGLSDAGFKIGLKQVRR
jgi:hypothetical protein